MHDKGTQTGMGNLQHFINCYKLLFILGCMILTLNNERNVVSSKSDMLINFIYLILVSYYQT